MDDAQRLAVARAAAASVLDDWCRFGGPAVQVDVLLVGEEVCVEVDGVVTPSDPEQDAAALRTSTAAHVHAELVDAAARVLPVCAVHAVGLHVQAAGGRATWWCRAGDHPLGPVGALAAPAEG